MPFAVRRSARLLGASVAVSWTSVQISAALGSVIVLEMTGDLALVGVPFFLFYLGSGLSAYPAGRLMDRHGRVPVLVGGHVVAAAGFLVGAVAFLIGQFPLFLVGTTLASLGAGATYLTRLAAADLYPARERGRGIALVIFPSVIGALVGTPIILLAQELEPLLGRSHLLIAWSMGPLLNLSAGVLVSLIRPDPREVALALQAQEPPPMAALEVGIQPGGRGRAIVAAGLTLMLAQTAMASVMAVAGASLKHAHATTNVISFAMTAHLVGMFFFTPWIGRLGDSWGRRALLGISAGLLLASLGSVAMWPDGRTLAFSLFGIGVGWSFAFIGATSLIADVTHATRRGHATGLVDLATAVLAGTGSAAAGWVLHSGGLRWVALYGIVIAAGILAAAVLLPLAKMELRAVATAK